MRADAVERVCYYYYSVDQQTDAGYACFAYYSVAVQSRQSAIHLASRDSILTVYICNGKKPHQPADDARLALFSYHNNTSARYVITTRAIIYFLLFYCIILRH